jgi:hypothetical protein
LTESLKIYRRSELEAIADGCLHRYKAIWIDGIDDSSDISLIGQAFARVKYVYLLRLVEQQLRADAEEAQAAFVQGVAESHLPAHLIPELKSVWDFHAAKFELDLDRFIAAEERGSAGGVGFAPDLVIAHPERNALEIVDDKSGWRPPMSEVELKANFQARVYSRYARDRWPHFGQYEFTLYAVRFNKRVTVSFTQAELDLVDVEIAAAIATIEHAKATNEWPAIPGPACRFCTLTCPIFDTSLTVLPQRLLPEKRVEVAAWVLVAEKQVAAIKKALKANVSEYGPISVHGVVWDHRPSNAKSYPLDAVLDAFKKLKIDRQAAEVQAAGGDMSISASALKKVVKLYPELEGLLAPAERIKVSYRFSAKKPGDDEEEE